jgi:hypothetical protein
MAIDKLKEKLKDPNITPKEQQRIRDRIRFEQEQAKSSKGDSKAKPILPKDTKINSVSSGIEAEKKVETTQAETAGKLQNPNITNDFGSQTTTFNADGTVSVNQDLAPDQKAILDKGSNLTKTGQDLATSQLTTSGFGQTFNPTLAGRTSTGDLLADRARIEQDAFTRLMGTTRQDYAREKEQLQQTLYNRGIPLNEVANRPEMKDLEQRYQNKEESARLNATAIGGDEMSRSFGMNEQLIANQLSQSQGIRNQNLGEVGALQNLGTGLQIPQFQQFTGPEFSLSNPIDVNTALEQLKQNQQQVNIAQQNANRRPSGGSTTAASSDFVNSTPPGFA